MAPARYQSVTPQAPTDPTPRYDADKGREHGDQGRMQDTDQGFTLLLSLLSLFGKSAHSSQDSCAAHSRERSRKGQGQNKVLPGLKWLKSERFFHFPHCRRFQPVYPGQSTQRKEGHERATDHYLRELLTSPRKNTTVQQGKDHPGESLTCLLPVSQLLQRASAGHMGEGTNVEAFQNT